jgi:hypothetical protein
LLPGVEERADRTDGLGLPVNGDTVSKRRGQQSQWTGNAVGDAQVGVAAWRR